MADGRDGGVLLADGTECKVVTGTDDHPRFCVIAKLVPRATARPVCEPLMEGLSRHGLPEQILTDNGKVFTGRLARRPEISWGVLFRRALGRILDGWVSAELCDEAAAQRIQEAVDRANAGRIYPLGNRPR